MDYSNELIKIAKSIEENLNIIQISKKTIIVKALYFNGKNIDEVKDFCKNNFDEKKMQIKTLEGANELRKGAYIIEGVKKENYCINEATLDKSYTIEKKDGNIFTLKTKSNKLSAVKFNGNNREDIFKWMKEEDKNEKFIVKASWGELEVSRGDYVVNGINGDYCPIKPDILKKTYDIL